MCTACLAIKIKYINSRKSFCYSIYQLLVTYFLSVCNTTSASKLFNPLLPNNIVQLESIAIATCNNSGLQICWLEAIVNNVVFVKDRNTGKGGK